MTDEEMLAAHEEEESLPAMIAHLESWCDHLGEPASSNHPYRKVIAAAKEYHRLQPFIKTVQEQRGKPIDPSQALNEDFEYRVAVGRLVKAACGEPK